MCQSGATCLEWYLVDSGPGQGIGVERHVWSGIWLTGLGQCVGVERHVWSGIWLTGLGQCVGVERHVWSGIWLTRDQDNVSEWSNMSGVVSG
jgi:hypothetical protein